MQHHDPNLGSRIQAEGMRINAQSKNHKRYGKRTSTKARLLLLLVALSPVIAVLWWVYS